MEIMLPSTHKISGGIHYPPRQPSLLLLYDYHDPRRTVHPVSGQSYGLHEADGSTFRHLDDNNNGVPSIFEPENVQQADRVGTYWQGRG